jgi:hypothetical protein
VSIAVDDFGNHGRNPCGCGGHGSPPSCCVRLRTS